MRKGTKRKATQKAEPKKVEPKKVEPKKAEPKTKRKPVEEQENEPSQSSEEPAAETNSEEPSRNAEPEPTKEEDGKGRRKRAKVAKPESETEYFPEKRNLEDLWQHVFPVGTEWDQLDTVYEYNWNFSNLEEALEEGGELHNKRVYLFACTEPQLVPYKDQSKVTMIPVVVAVVSPIPPSDKIGVKSVQRETEEILPMKSMKMDWVPYIPLEDREAQLERLKDAKIFILSCNQRRAGLRHLTIDRIKKFEYCLPYFYNPHKEDELEQSTIVNLMFPIEPPVVCEFDWEFDEVEEFTDKLIEGEELPADQKEPFKDYLKETVREAKKANRQAREARKKAREEMSSQTKSAFESMKFYKFYPVPTPDTPDVSGVKAPFINRYYGKAHKVI